MSLALLVYKVQNALSQGANPIADIKGIPNILWNQIPNCQTKNEGKVVQW